MSLADSLNPRLISGNPPGCECLARPAASQNAVWKYKAIYCLHDEQCGLWSDVFSQAVMGA